MTSDISSVKENKIEKRKLLKRMPKVNSSQARSNLEVLRKCLDDLGWKECISSIFTDVDIYWNAGTFHDGNRNYTSTSARVNKFPGMCDLLCKTNLTRSLNVMRMLFPDEFDFYPKTWFIPEQIEQFQEDARVIHKEDRRRHRSLTTFIVKPSDGSEGAGIYLTQDPNRCNGANRPYVVQEYIDRPLLIDGLKFDIRIYVLILCLDPLKIFLYEEGLVRFATVDYQIPSRKNLHETFMHLTNYSLNKRSVNYKHALDDTQTDASKRKLTLVWSQLTQLFSQNEIQHTKEMIEEMINKTVLAILPELRVQYAMELPMDNKQNRCFQIIGFDILLTNELKPILLEVNANPSLRIDFDHANEAGKYVHDPSPIDEEIKKPLVLQTLKLVMKSKRHHRLKTNDEILTQSELSDQNDSNQQMNIDTTLINQIHTSDSIKSLKIIFPSTSGVQYDDMFLLEKIAFIYIEIVIKRGYKSMTNRPFRNLANICGLIDQSTPMSSIDILYTQMFCKCKQSDVQSPAIGLFFPAFIEAFFLLSQRRSSSTSNLFNNVNEMVNTCIHHLNLPM